MTKICIIIHETLWAEKLIDTIYKKYNDLMIIPVLEKVSKGDILPNVKGKVFRGKDKYLNILKEKPEIIIDTKFEWCNLLLTTDYRPKSIFLFTRTSNINYLKLSKSEKEYLSSIYFVSFWHSVLKSPDSKGVSKSGYKYISNFYNFNRKKKFLIIGFGQVGEKFADYLHNKSQIISVYDIDPVKKIIAYKNGYKVGNLEELSKDVDIVIDCSGSSNVINEKELSFFRKKIVHFISFSTNGDSFNFNTKIHNGCILYKHPTKGLSNFYKQIGGNFDADMQITGQSIIHFIKNWENMLSKLIKLDSGLYILSKDQENNIAESIDLTSQTNLLI